MDARTLTAKDAITLAKNHDCRLVALRSADLAGRWHEVTVPVQQLAAVLEHGLCVDGGALGAELHATRPGLRLRPIAASARVDPFAAQRSLGIVCEMVDAASGRIDPCDTRAAACRAVQQLRAVGVAEALRVALRVDFFAFDAVRFGNNEQGAFYEVGGGEATCGSGRDRPPHLRGAPGTSSAGSLPDLCALLATALVEAGTPLRLVRPAADRAGHCRVELGDLGLVEAADELLWLKHAIGHVARRLGYSATFMPQPLHGAAGSGLGCRQALWQGDRNLFAGPGAGATSDLCRWYAAGILAHAPALAALANPTTNSFRRLASPGAPTELAWPPPEQAAALQLVGSAPAPQSELGIEARFPDPSCNPYLALSALLMAGLDGIRRRLDPPAPKRRRSAPRGAASTGTGRLPASLGEALDAIERDHGFLLEGEVFGAELIERSVRDKREREIAEQAARPVPYEFELYYDV